MARWALVSGESAFVIVEGERPPGLADWREVPADVQNGHRLADGQWRAPRAGTTVTPAQIRLALDAIGKLDAVQPAIDAMTGAVKRRTQIIWDHSPEIARRNPSIVILGNALGMTKAEVDALFEAAAAL